jgi:hypothetical protein
VAAVPLRHSLTPPHHVSYPYITGVLYIVIFTDLESIDVTVLN